jgi:hypothetical protein
VPKRLERLASFFLLTVGKSRAAFDYLLDEPAAGLTRSLPLVSPLGLLTAVFPERFPRSGDHQYHRCHHQPAKAKAGYCTVALLKKMAETCDLRVLFS